MDHNYIRNDNFNILTARREKGHLIFTGETRESLEVGDVINYAFGGFNQYSIVDKIIERRDAKAYPKGNGMWYSCECSGMVIDRERAKALGVAWAEEKRDEPKKKERL
jgi:hypothetical protein